jgi:4-hydroxy-tetrahydrodipicolinate synthase
MELANTLCDEIFYVEAVMVKVPVFKGSCTAIVTPFDEHGVDYERLKKNLEFQYENGTSAIVVCGTTGENATHTPNEHDELVRVTVRTVNGRMKVIAGIGSNNTENALRAAENAKYSGADAVLMVTPYYNKTTQKGLIEHFSYVADRVDIPMILYNVPSRTGIGITADTCKVLSQHPNINGIKEASGDISLAAKIRSLCGDDLYIWSGNDDCTIPLMSLGALGVISVASNIVPGAVAKLCALCLEGSYAEATELYAKYASLFSALFIETNPIPVKAALKMMGMDSGILRLPLTEISQESFETLLKAMRDAGINV